MKKNVLFLILLVTIALLGISCNRENAPFPIGDGFSKFYTLSSQKDTLWGVKNSQGKIRIPAEHTSINYLNGCFLAGVENGILLKDSNNLLIFTQCFEKIALREDTLPVVQSFFECHNEEGGFFYVPKTGQKFQNIDDLIFGENEIIFVRNNEIGAKTLGGDDFIEDAFSEFYIVKIAKSSEYYYLMKLNDSWLIYEKTRIKGQMVREQKLKEIVLLADKYSEQQWHHGNYIGIFVIDKLPFTFRK